MAVKHVYGKKVSMYQLLNLEAVEKQFETVKSVPTVHRLAWRWLSTTDRSLIELCAVGASHRAVAQALGITPGTVSRRLNAIQERLALPGVRFLLDPQCPLEPDARRIAILRHVTRLTARQIAQSMGITTHAARSSLSYSDGLIRGLNTRALKFD